MTIDVLEWCFRVFSALNVINHKFLQRVSIALAMQSAVLAMIDSV